MSPSSPDSSTRQTCMEVTDHWRFGGFQYREGVATKLKEGCDWTAGSQQGTCVLTVGAPWRHSVQPDSSLWRRVTGSHFHHSRLNVYLCKWGSQRVGKTLIMWHLLQATGAKFIELVINHHHHVMFQKASWIKYYDTLWRLMVYTKTIVVKKDKIGSASHLTLLIWWGK